MKDSWLDSDFKSITRGQSLFSSLGRRGQTIVPLASRKAVSRHLLRCVLTFTIITSKVSAACCRSLLLKERGEKDSTAAARCSACICPAGKAQIFKPTVSNNAAGCTLEDLLLPAQETGVRIITVCHQRKQQRVARAMKRLYCSKFGFYKRGRKLD